MLNLVIFGANGFIANALINKTKSSNNLILISRKNYESNTNKNYSEIYFDLSKKNNSINIQKVSEKIQNKLTINKTIFLLIAWEGKSFKGEISKKISFENNQIIENYINIAKKVNPEQNIFLSSAGSIYDQNNLNFSKENDIPKPYSKYGFEKLYAEKYLQKEIKNKLLILRISSVYGCRNKLGRQGVISNWINKCLLNEPLEIYNTLDSKINFISVEQLCEAILLSIKFNLKGLYNIGTNRSTTIQQIIDQIKKVHKMNIKISFKSKLNKRFFLLDTNLFTEFTDASFDSKCISDITNIYTYYKSKRKLF